MLNQVGPVFLWVDDKTLEGIEVNYDDMEMVQWSLSGASQEA